MWKETALPQTRPPVSAGLARHSCALHTSRRAPPTTRIRLDPSSSICGWCKLLMFSILLILLLTKKSFFSRVSLSTPSMFLSRLKKYLKPWEQAKHSLENWSALTQDRS